MSPYQYHVEIPEEWAGLQDALTSLDPEELEKFAMKILETPENNPPYVFPPPISSHFDHPVSIMGPDMSLGVARNARSRKANEIRPKLPWLVSLSDSELPKTPSSDALSLMINIHSKSLATIKAMFEERPIVSRAYAAHTTGISYSDLARVLPVFAYCFTDGPWRNCWVPYGIDPRLDNQYRIYQIVQCRNNLVSEGLATAESDGPHYIFTGTSSGPHFSQFQYCDLLYPPLQERVNSPDNLRKCCSKTEGWYPAGTVNFIRKTIRKRWLEVLQQRDPEAWKRQVELIEQARIQKSKESADNLKKEDGDDDDGEEGEGEEDEDEDEMEDYEFYDEE